MSDGAAAFALRRDVGAATRARLERHLELLRAWTPRINLVAPSTLADPWRRHVEDSAQLLDHVPPGVRSWADIGSGAGFPGLVVAILAAERLPELTVTLIESDTRKAAFLRTAAQETDVAVTVVVGRAESVAPCGADVVSARAVAPLPALLAPVARHLGPRGVALLHKGARHAAELREALASWRAEVQTFPSTTDPSAVVLAFRGLRRA